MVLKQIRSRFRKEFQETVQPIERFSRYRYNVIGKKYIGNSKSVKADWNDIICLENFDGFFHEHPIGNLKPSLTDIATMDSWCKATGKNLFLLIKSGSEVREYLFFHHLGHVYFICLSLAWMATK